MSELPVGWSSSAIGELCTLVICTLVNGRAFKPAEWQEKGLPIVRIQNLNNKDALFNNFGGDYADKHYLRGGELLFAWSGTPGTSFGAHIWDRGEAVLNQHIFRVDFDEANLDKRFFRHAINQKLNELIGIAHGGVGLRHVTKGKFEKTEVLIPPLNEQKRIADKLEQLLARVDKARERLEGIPRFLERFRRAVFNFATSGQLTEEWRLLNQPETDSNLDNWKHLKIGALITSKPRNGYSPKAVDFPTNVKSLTLTATTSGKFKSEHSKFIDEDISADSYLWLEPGDILIQRGNTLEYVGVSAIFDGPSNTFIYPDLMMKCRANKQTLTKFLYYLLSSDKVRSFYRDNATGTAGNMPKINQKTAVSAPVHVAPIKEQQEIIRRAERLFAFADRLNARYEEAMKQVERLTPAILAKAFRGELVPQDPNDEPASVLLERIQAARTAAPKQPRKKSGRRKPVRKKPVETLVELADVLDKLGGEALPDRLLTEAALEDDVDFFFELLRQGRDDSLLEVPVGENTPIRKLARAN